MSRSNSSGARRRGLARLLSRPRSTTARETRTPFGNSSLGGVNSSDGLPSGAAHAPRPSLAPPARRRQVRSARAAAAGCSGGVRVGKHAVVGRRRVQGSREELRRSGSLRSPPKRPAINVVTHLQRRERRGAAGAPRRGPFVAVPHRLRLSLGALLKRSPAARSCVFLGWSSDGAHLLGYTPASTVPYLSWWGVTHPSVAGVGASEEQPRLVEVARVPLCAAALDGGVAGQLSLEVSVLQPPGGLVIAVTREVDSRDARAPRTCHILAAPSPGLVRHPSLLAAASVHTSVLVSFPFPRTTAAHVVVDPRNPRAWTLAVTTVDSVQLLRFSLARQGGVDGSDADACVTINTVRAAADEPQSAGDDGGAAERDASVKPPCLTGSDVDSTLAPSTTTMEEDVSQVPWKVSVGDVTWSSPRMGLQARSPAAVVAVASPVAPLWDMDVGVRRLVPGTVVDYDIRIMTVGWVGGQQSAVALVVLDHTRDASTASFSRTAVIAQLQPQRATVGVARVKSRHVRAVLEKIQRDDSDVAMRRITEVSLARFTSLLGRLLQHHYLAPARTAAQQRELTNEAFLKGRSLTALMNPCLPVACVL